MQCQLFNIEPQPSAISTKRKLEKIARLRAKVFIYSTSHFDELFFRRSIQGYLFGYGKETLTKTMWFAIWVRNENGHASKYLHFNERSQRLYIDNDFYEWAKLTCQVMYSQLKPD